MNSRRGNAVPIPQAGLRYKDGMRLLLVEDDDRLAATLREGLSRVGIGVELARDAVDGPGEHDVEDHDIDPLDGEHRQRADGVALCGELRRRRVATPVLMLTARDSVADRVRGLEAGADDYLVKPFAFDELVARLRALSRRHLEVRGAVLGEGEVRLDTAALEVLVGAERVPLTLREHSLLEALMLHPGQVLSRQQLEDRVWNSALTPESNLVEVYIARLRRKLREAGAPDVLETVRGAGYRVRRRVPTAPCADA